jgi:hypothetical protein
MLLCIYYAIFYIIDRITLLLMLLLFFFIFILCIVSSYSYFVLYNSGFNYNVPATCHIALNRKVWYIQNKRKINSNINNNSVSLWFSNLNLLYTYSDNYYCPTIHHHLCSWDEFSLHSQQCHSSLTSFTSSLDLTALKWTLADSTYSWLTYWLTALSKWARATH